MDHEGGATRALREYPEPWNPSEPVDLEGLDSYALFVIADHSAICPTRRQAEQRECGNSSERSEEGLRLQRGDSVQVVGDPFDGQYRALRFQVGGVLPSWIVAEDLSDTPDISNLDAFAERTDVEMALDVSSLQASALAALAPGTVVRLMRKSQVRLMFRGTPEGLEGVESFLAVPVGSPTTGRQPIAVAIAEDLDSDAPHWAEHHFAAMDGDTMELDYVCQRGGYCDAISILAVVTESRIQPPTRGLSDAEYAEMIDEWPPAWSAPMPVWYAKVLADRFGIYELARPSWAADTD